MEEGESFAEFTNRCIRAMGVCVDMRDEPMSVPVPESFAIAEYYIESLEEAEIDFHEMASKSEEDALAWGIAEQKRSLLYWIESEERISRQNRRLIEMHGMIQEWVPPSEEHEGFKIFMLNQLAISIDSTQYQSEKIREIIGLEPLGIYFLGVESLWEDVQHREEYLQEELDRVKGKNEWLRQLRESLHKQEKIN